MKTIKILALITLFIGFTSCDKDGDPIPLLEIAFETFSNLHAPQVGEFGQPNSGEFAKFDFATGQTTTSDADWDIAFRGLSIIVNGGVSFGAIDEPARTGDAAVYIASGTMASVTEVDTTLFTQDSLDGYAIIKVSDQGWYHYAGAPTHLITPILGKILIFRTRDGKYAKVEIRSYYKDSNTSNNPRYYTFDYVYQPNDGVLTF